MFHLRRIRFFLYLSFFRLLRSLVLVFFVSRLLVFIYFAFHNMRSFILGPLFMHVLPSEVQLLDFYLGQPWQDPEWVHFVYERMAECTNLPAQFGARFQSFMNIELCTSTRDMIIELYKTIFYGKEDPLLFIPRHDLDLFLRAALGSFDFDQAALSEILRSLCQDRHESPFYSGLLESNADAFNQIWQQQHNAEIEMHRRTQDYLEALRLEGRNRELSEQNQFLVSELQRRGIEVNRDHSADDEA